MIATTQDLDDSAFDLDGAKRLETIIKRHYLLSKNDEDYHFALALAILLTALRWYGQDRHLIEALPDISGRNLDITDVLNALAHLGFTNHRILSSIKDVDERLFPCLFLKDENFDSPVVLYRTEAEGMIAWVDCKSSDISIINKQSRVSGTAYCFEKIDPAAIEEEQQIKEKAGYNWFRLLFERFSNVFKHILVISFIINLFGLAMPIFVMTVYDKVIDAGSVQTLEYLLAGVLLAILVETVLRFMRTKTICWLGVRLDNIVSNAIFERLLFIPASYTENASVASQISRIKSFESVRDFFTGSLFLVLIETPFVLVLLVAIWIIAGPLVIIPLVVAAVYLLTLYFFYSRLKVAIRFSAKSTATKNQFGMETFLKVQSLRYNGIADTWLQNYREITASASINSFRSNFIASIIETIAYSLSILAAVAVIAFGVNRIWDGNMTIGALVATMIIIWRVLSPLQTICSMLPRLEQLKNSLAQVNRIMTIKEEGSFRVQKNIRNEFNGQVQLTNVGLRYSRDIEPVIFGLNLDIRAGETVAIIGGNGSGKTSLLKILNGLYSPQAGNIRIDGIDLRQIDPIQLRYQIAYLPQIPDFFTGTVRDNLRLANLLAKDKELLQVIEKVDVLDYLKDGLDTEIQANDSALSSSLIYRLNLARVLLNNSNILLLDELPNAALNRYEGEVYRQLIAESKGLRTVFFVTHRDDYLRMADKVIVLQVGKRPQVLTPDDVINKYREF